VVIDEATAEIGPGERVLITGESGSGKSTLFRAIAGLWPWGEGVIRLPPRERMMFLPQRPYLPLGTLRAAVCYPARPDAFDEEQVRASLERCGLAEFVDQLEKADRWDKTMSLGQLQRLAFARMLLHRPSWLFLDEATSSLDEENQEVVMSLFDNELAEATVLSIGHRPGLELFHTRTLVLRATDQGAVLLGRRQRPAAGPQRWRSRLARWLVGVARPAA
jgi:vitamin B12/bleomycin/antimicrobial peptide transport system ATP-binding/permease protein